MNKKLGERVVTEHGPISSVLPAQSLVEQVKMSNINARTYKITVPWFSVSILRTINVATVFPKIDDISDEFVCKRIETEISGEKGCFFGSVNKQTNQPLGEGVFKAENGWITCGGVKNGIFTDGRSVSVNYKTDRLHVKNTKGLADGTLLQKVDTFGVSGKLKSKLYVDGAEEADLIDRINLTSEDSSWLAFSSLSSRVSRDFDFLLFGEHNSDDKLNGRGIFTDENGNIRIGYWNNGVIAPGNFIKIFSNGVFIVGELYMKDGEKCYRFTQYNKDGTTSEFFD